MTTKGKGEQELWKALEGLDRDLLHPGLPEALVDEELKALGIEPAALANRGIEFVARTKEQERLSWQTRARDRRAQLQAQVSRSAAMLPADMGREAILARLEELRTGDPNVGTAIKMAARKRKPEESTDQELRTLLEEMEALRSIEDADPE